MPSCAQSAAPTTGINLLCFSSLGDKFKRGTWRFVLTDIKGLIINKDWCYDEFPSILAASKDFTHMMQ
ncbi:hypothetical protein DPMN_168280 [Dreissena polymorpha]|uniref:Uncharacterized protein n=1 Tax=Dreissena polymorpha TaxID=45954 RepID=A0A9D4IX31_DREPO|nr:hypothetical protein DPMN_168280 [Dreissena polymorpha]